MTVSLAQSLVDAAAEAIAAAFNDNLIGYVAVVDGKEVTFNPEDIQFVRTVDGPSLWEHMARAALATTPYATALAARKAVFEHADQLMVTAADMYRKAADLRESPCP
jgi:hypothetical protein